MPRKAKKDALASRASDSIFIPADRTPIIARRGRQPKRIVPDERTLFTDFRTYCEELLIIRDKRGRTIPFRWNLSQERLWGLKQQAREQGKSRMLILKYRRPGISTFEQAESFFGVANNMNQYAVTLAHDKESTQRIFEISLLFYNKLPKWAKPLRKTDNKRELNFSGLGSTFYIGTAGGVSFGRGMTLQRVHGSEVAFWPKSVDVPNLVAGLLEAASHGEVVFESTANGYGNWFQKTWFGAKANENEWVPIFLSWVEDPELSMPTTKELDDLHLSTKEEELARQYKLTAGQVLWMRHKKRELYDPDRGELLFHQEYPINDITAFISSGSCFFDAEVMQHLSTLCEQPIEKADQGRLKIWKQPELYRKYVIGSDIGEGVAEGDKTVIVVVDCESCKEVASWAGICSPEEAGRKMVDLAMLYNRALIAPEANQFGHSTINTIINEIGYGNIYQHVDYQAVDILESGAVKPRFGWQTNAKTRPILISEFRRALQNGLYKANDPDLFSECLTFVDNGHGKYEAASGAMDDRVIAHAIAWQARKQQYEIVDLSRYAVDTGFTSISVLMEEF